MCVCVCARARARALVYFYDLDIESKLSGQFVRLYLDFSKLRFFGGQVNILDLIVFCLGISAMRTLR